MTDNIEQLIVDLSHASHDPVANFNAGEEYRRLDQFASAISFYLRCAEFGHDTHPDYVYASLLQIGNCFEAQQKRSHTVSNSYLQAAAYNPQRPEAWFLLARFHERAQNWQEAYTFAVTGFGFTRFTVPPLPVNVQYPGEYGLLFEKYVAGWWIGRKQEAIDGFTDLLNTYDMDAEFVEASVNNLQRIR